MQVLNGTTHTCSFSHQFIRLTGVSLLSSGVGLAMMLLSGRPGVAQVNPAPVLPREGLPQDVIPREPQPPSTQPLPEPSPQPLPPPAELLPGSVVPSPEPPADAPEFIVVQRFIVTGSTVFTPEELAAVTQPFVGRRITLAELFQARSAITQLYVERGYITSGAYIPPQTLKAGVVEIRVLEGKLEAINVTGTRRLNPNYVRRRLAIATQPPLNRDRLLEALQLLQLDPLIQNLSAELSAGVRPGENLLDVQVTEADSLEGRVAFDNSRSPSVGTGRRIAQVTEANLLGIGDRLSLGYTDTNGSSTVDGGYSIPLNARNGTLSFNASLSESRVIEPDFRILDITSKSRYFELSFRQPIVRKPSREIALGLTATHQRSEARLFGGELAFPTPGSNSEGQTRLTALRFFQDATWRSNVEVIALRSQFSVGLGAFNASINPISPDSRFFSWRGQAQWVRLLAPDTLLLVRGDMQLADRPLLAVEQFGLGGLTTVRGYRQDALLTDSGAFVSAEVRLPIARFPRAQGLLQLAPFIDVGRGWNLSDRPDPDPAILASVGLGLRLQLFDRVTARLDWGIPLVSFPGRKRTLQENGLYFSIEAILF